jgi:hypothetical protein
LTALALDRRIDQLTQYRVADGSSVNSHGTPPVDGLQQLHGSPGSLGRDRQERSLEWLEATIPPKSGARVD